MKIKLELLKRYLTDLEDIEIDADKIADSVAIRMLSEIQIIIKDETCSDFDAVEKIVCVFEKNKIDFGLRHDF